MKDTAIIAAVVGGILAIIAAIAGALVQSERLIFTNWDRWRRNLPPGFVIFVNGASGVGKSSVAWALARKYNVSSVFGSDLVREALREGIPDDLAHPSSALLTSSFLAYTRMPALAAAAPEQAVVEGFRHQSSLLLGPLSRIVTRIRRKRDPVIIEGVNIVGTQLFSRIPNDPYVGILFVNLYLDAEDKHRARLRERGTKSNEPGDVTDRYIQNLAAIRRVDRFLREDSQSLTTAPAGVVSNVLSIENSGPLSKTLNTIDKHLKRKCKVLERGHA